MMTSTDRAQNALRRALAFLPLLLLAAALLFGCGPVRKPPTVYDQPTVPMGYYDEVWVEPTILHADSLFTLIRAVRKDSVFVRTGESTPTKDAPSLEFVIAQDTCFVQVALHFIEGDHNAIPLVARYFTRGSYKLSINEPIKIDGEYYRYSYMLRATICGRSVQVPVIR